MKAIILKKYGTADNFELADIPIPAVQRGQVRIKIKAASFNPVDYQIRKGLSESKMVTSNILGRDLSGIVDAVGDEVTDFEKGDEVYCYVCDLGSSGTYTEYVSVPQEIVAKKPASLTHEEAASIPVAAITAIIALTKAEAERSKSIFIAGGAGGVGSFVISFAKYLGIDQLMTTAGNDKSRSYLVSHFGLKDEQIINYKEEKFVQQAIERNGCHFEAVIDLVGNKMLAACCELISVDGHLVSIVDAPDKDSFEFLFQRNASFHSVGANAYSLGDRGLWQTYRRVLNYISRAYENNGVCKPGITVLGYLSVDVVKQAHELLEKTAVQGKLIMTCPD